VKSRRLNCDDSRLKILVLVLTINEKDELGGRVTCKGGKSVLWRSSILSCRIRFNEKERISKSWGGQTRQASPIITRATVRRFMVFVPHEIKKCQRTLMQRAK